MPGGVKTTADLGKALQCGLSLIVDKQYKLYSDNAIYKKVFNFVSEKKKGYVEDQLFSDIGLLTLKGQGAPITFDKNGATFSKRYTFLTYAGGIKITSEAIDDNQYASQMTREGPLLARAENETREVVSANVINRGFNSAYVGADGKELFATDHPFQKGGTWRNELTVPGSLNPINLEQATIDISNWLTESGNRMSFRPQTLLVPADLMFDAKRILMGDMQYDTANHTPNVLKGIFPGGIIVWNHLTDTNAWFILTNFDDRSGLNFIERKAPVIESDNDFVTKDFLYSIVSRYEAGWTDAHKVFGSPGA